MADLMSNSDFIMLLFANTGFYYVVAGIQYWCVNYMQQVLHASYATATLYFAFTAFFAPLTGVLFGGALISYYGGYNSRRSREILLIMGWACTAFAIPVPIVDNFTSFGILIFGLLFCGASLLPSLTGIMLNCVPDHQRASANSLAQVSYNLFGWMPAPFVYGLVSQIAGDSQVLGDKEKSRVPLAFIIYSEVFTLALMTIVILRKLRTENLENQLLKAEVLFQKQQEGDEES